MGQRSAGKTIAAILLAFLRERTWKQKALADHCGISPKALRARLLELSEGGMPLEAENDPPHVFWSVPKSWVPDGTILSPRQVATVARLVSRLPPSKERSDALRALLRADASVSMEPSLDAALTKVLTILEDGVREQRAVKIDYFGVSRGDRDRREISVHRIFYGDRMRMLATCHRTDTLKYFRVDGVRDASLGTTSAFRAVSADEIQAFLATSVDGFRTSGPAHKHVFVIRYPEARWAKVNHPPCAMEAEPIEEGIRFTARVAGIEPLARFVVGLGEAARAETPELAERMREIAIGALQGMKPIRKVNTRSVRPNRAAR
jgi:predicted DNA-binding transcriptional regulator YafY